MSGRVIRFEGSAHHEADRLLPWLVNGSLDGEELAQVQGHLGECTACRHEVAWLRSLQDGCHEAGAPPLRSGVRASRRLRRRLDAARAIRRTGWGRSGKWLLAVVAAQAVLVLILGVSLLRVAWPPEPAYHTLGAAPVPQVRLVVVFDAGISEARMQRILRANDAHIVYGPTDAGGYELSVPAARAATVLEALRVAPGVSLAERLDAGAGH